jgi:type IV pilus assembly protein PilM
VPDWNKELSFSLRRRPKAAPVVAAEVEVEPLPAAWPPRTSGPLAAWPPLPQGSDPGQTPDTAPTDVTETTKALQIPTFEPTEPSPEPPRLGSDPGQTPDTATVDRTEPRAKRLRRPAKAPKAAKPPKPAKQPKPKRRRGETAPRATVVVGLKVGASQLAAARVQNGSAPELLQVARRPLAEGIVVGGELRDVDGLADALRVFFEEEKLPKKGIRLGIANNRIGVRTFELAGIQDSGQLANAIRFRAQEILPITLEEAVLDWHVLREETDEEGTTTRHVLLVVAYRELVDRYVAACRKAGLELDGIDLEAFAMLRSLTVPAPDDAPPGAQVVVNVGHDRATFAVTDGRVCEFTRVVEWGGRNLNVAIARTLDVAPSEAAPIKHTLSLADDRLAGVPTDRAAAVLAAVRAELQGFARELVSSLRFYQNQPGSLGISELVLSGGTAHLPGLAAELESLVGVTVRLGDPTARLALGKLAGVEHAGSLAVAIGLGIED